ncbi:MAG: DUF255 domain-containing protein [Cytophagaceae bacterium]|nr:DUF255 domain-containing protein [Cytophagaceae bacterium]MBL0302818.1 DUF255 domain-containing protein [Cytophagaceae bacterium]MBL0325645.1 DUF255 domain-containing protein [Cytophagaceae bacterium]
MNKIFFGVLFFVFIGFKNSVSGQNVKFNKNQEISFAEVLKMAEKENKLVFMDVYTTWCGPCKLMDKTTFADSTVGKVFNEKFINFKVNGEDAEGVNIVKKYRINAYPTFIFLDSKGELVNRLEGVFPSKLLIEESEYTMKLWKESK